MLQFKFTEPIELFKATSSRTGTREHDRSVLDKLYLKDEHEKATASVIKALKDSRFDCEYEVNQIILNKQREVDRLNEARRQEMSHNMQHYVEMEIPEWFRNNMKTFQRVLQISFESTMRDIYTATVDDFKA